MEPTSRTYYIWLATVECDLLAHEVIALEISVNDSLLELCSS